MAGDFVIRADRRETPLPRDVMEELLARMESEDFEGRLEERRESAALARRLRAIFQSDAGIFDATESEQQTLGGALRRWLDEVKLPNFPAAAKHLLDALDTAETDRQGR